MSKWFSRLSHRKKFYIIILLILLIPALFLAVRALLVLHSVGSFQRAWLREAQQPIETDSIVIAAIGDSTVQGIGALRKDDGFVGQIANRTEERTGKKVQVYNYSVTGARSDEVVDVQLSKVSELERYDVVVVAVGPNDITQKRSLEAFTKNYKKILQALPAEKTVIATLPPMGPKDVDGQSSFIWGQSVAKLAADFDVRVAPVFEKVNALGGDFRTYGGDFYHPSKFGYTLWADAFEQPVLEIVTK